MASNKDKDGDWLDGGRNYVLHVPPDAPAETFWSITLYDVDTRCLLQNEQKIADRSSRMDLIKNADGSVDIYMGPDAPKGKEANWIPTVPGKASGQSHQASRIFGVSDAAFSSGCFGA
jgi:hypothetical protein